MAMFGECVGCVAWKERAIAAEDRERALMEKYHSLRPTHAPVSPARIIRQGKSADERALGTIEGALTGSDSRVANAFTKLKAQGVPDVEAMAEARRMVQHIDGDDVNGPLFIGS
jgi:hypothetical protein